MREITLDHLPLGYAARGGRKGNECEVVFREFVSTEDGQRFISLLEGIPTQILEKISPDANAAAALTHNLLAVIRPDKTAAVYWNEFYPTFVARAKQPLAKGEKVMRDHILDIE